MRCTSSSTGCPVSHGAGSSSSPPNRYYRAASFSPPPASKSLPPKPADHDDVTSPATLPDVSDDKNPCYEEYDEDLLYTNLRERVKYITQFVNFTEHDVEALNDFQPILLPMVPQLVDNVYHHLFKFDVTKKVFMPRKEGHEGRMLADLHDLALDAPQIELRKRTFAVYMRKLVTLDYDDFATWQYFDHIGIMHTGKNELKHRKLMGKAPLFVDLMHLSLLLAWTLDVLTPVILSYTEYPLSRRIEIMQAFQKVVWIQNDLFSRHYAVRSTEVAGLNQIRSTHDLSSSDDLNSIISAHATSSESTANGHGGTPAGSKFLPDLSNPLHAFSGSGHKATASGKANGAVNNMMGMGDASASVPDIGNVNGNPPPVPQLNTSGFKKKKGSLATPSNNKNSGLGAGAAGSGAFSNTAVTGIDGFGISRPATADPHRTANVAGHGSTGIRPRASLGSNLDPSSGAPGANGRQGGAGGGGGARNPFGSKPTSHPPKLLAPAPITAASPSLFNTNGVNHVGGTFNANLDSSGSAPSFSGLTTPGVALTGQNGADMRQDRDWAGLAPERPHTSMRNDQGRNVSNAVQQSNQQQAFRGPVFNLGVARTPDTSTETLVDQDDDSFDHSRGSKPGLDGFGQFLPTSGSGIVGDAAGGGGGGGPRRVILDKGYHQNHGNQYDDRGQHDLLSGHAINDQGRVFQQMPGPGMSAPGGRKRHREQADLDQDGMRYDMPGSNRMKMARVVDENQGMDDHMNGLMGLKSAQRHVLPYRADKQVYRVSQFG
ncbi:hypothetical protein MD484_g2253, partial [Candolleomyces efflorescens]